MLYYKVKTPDKLFRFNGYMQTIKDELFTPGEVKKYSAVDKYGYKLKTEWLETVYINKSKTLWFFGARFREED